jgi:hypothetical protein
LGINTILVISPILYIHYSNCNKGSIRKLLYIKEVWVSQQTALSKSRCMHVRRIKK